MNTQRDRQMAEAVQLFFIAFAVIGLFWMDLEQLIYGEVQPRLVDDLIPLVWSAVAWCAYYLGLEHGKQIPR